MTQPNQALNTVDHEKVTTYNPATAKPQATYTLHTTEEMNQIVEEAHTAFLEWKTTSFSQRAQILLKAAQILERDQDELAKLMANQMGKPLKQGRQEVKLCAQILKFTAENGESVLADTDQEVMFGSKGKISYQPLGVILGLQPWNFPVYQCMRYSCAVIMAGNTTVFKHATLCLEMAFKIQQIYEEAGLPKGVFSIVYASGSSANKLIDHPKVRGVTYTGSAEVGSKVAKQAGAALKPTVMELGGSDPYLVLEDADLELALSELVKGRIQNAGQVCTGVKRIFVHTSLYETFKTKYVEAMKSVKVGNPLDSETQMGPMSTTSLRDKVHKQVLESVELGAELLCGGYVPEQEGAWYPPTVLANIPKDAPAYVEEIFGPVVSLFEFDALEDALHIANSHKYGLGGGVFSKDEQKALQICREHLDVGILNVNRYGSAQPNIPFGGVRDSGWGREHAGFGLKAFVNVKGITVA